MFEPLTVADYLLSVAIIAGAICICMGLLWLAAGVIGSVLDAWWHL